MNLTILEKRRRFTQLESEYHWRKARGMNAMPLGLFQWLQFGDPSDYNRRLR